MDIVKKYFPEFSSQQHSQLLRLPELYSYWNKRINVISRKDIENLAINHILHSLSIAMFYKFTPGTTVVDVGTGGGFPGIPLAIAFPETKFTMVDSIAKKLKVIDIITDTTGLKNCKTIHARIEKTKGQFDFVVSRAVTQFPKFVELTKRKISPHNKHTFKNGIIYLKGGDFTDELKPFRGHTKITHLSDTFTEPFFETKKIIYLPLSK